MLLNRHITAIATSAAAALLSMLGTAAAQTAPACTGDNGGITLSPGFCATVFADNLGHVRHMAVAADGTLYVNTWSGQYFRNAPPAPPGAFQVALKDTDGDGKADVVQRFGTTPEGGGAGGSGIALYRGGVYVELLPQLVSILLNLRRLLRLRRRGGVRAEALTDGG